MSGKIDEGLIRAAATLARMAPLEWQSFLQAFSVHAAQRDEELVGSALAMLPVAQGRAQEAREMLGLYTECTKTADKLEVRYREAGQSAVAARRERSYP